MSFGIDVGRQQLTVAADRIDALMRNGSRLAFAAVSHGCITTSMHLISVKDGIKCGDGFVGLTQTSSQTNKGKHSIALAASPTRRWIS